MVKSTGFNFNLILKVNIQLALMVRAEGEWTMVLGLLIQVQICEYHSGVRALPPPKELPPAIHL